MGNSSSIDVFIDHLDDDSLLSHLEFNDTQILRQDASETFMSSDIALSVQRVRRELNAMNPRSTNDSVININLSQIRRSMDRQEADDDDNKNNLSLSFISPSTTNNDSSPPRRDRVFVAQSLSPPIFNNNSTPSTNWRSQIRPNVVPNNNMFVLPNSPIMLHSQSPSLSYSFSYSQSDS